MNTNDSPTYSFDGYDRIRQHLFEVAVAAIEPVLSKVDPKHPDFPCDLKMLREEILPFARLAARIEAARLGIKVTDGELRTIGLRAGVSGFYNSASEELREEAEGYIKDMKES